MTTNIAQPPDPLSPEEADRLASRIRPSWELDDGDFAEGGDPSVESLARGGVSPGITKESAPFSDPAANSPHDTMIDSGPTISAARTVESASLVVDTTATPQSKSGRQKAVGATRMGLGDPDEFLDSQAIVSSKIVSIGEAAPVAASPAASANAEAPPPPSKRAASVSTPQSDPPRRSLVASSAPPPAMPPPVVPVQPSYSRADDPIEIPVQKISRSVLFAIGGAAILAAVLGGVAIFSGADPKKTDAPQSSEPASPKATETAKAVETAKPAETAKSVDPTPSVTAAPEPTSASASKRDPEVAKPEPVKPDPVKPKPSSGTGNNPPASGGKKPPKSGGGGIIRDAPF